MRTFLLAAAIFMLVMVGVPPSGAQTQTSETKIYGYFSINGKAPAAFRDIEIMDIEMPPYVDSTKPHAPPDYGRIRTSQGRRAITIDYELLKPTLDGKNLSFKTKAVRGVSYEFDGTLTRTNFDEPRPEYNEIVLRGTLKKLKAGKPIATSKVGYTWQLGD
jgi:hypothetical protein